MLSHDEALELLKGKDSRGFIIKHSLVVNKIVNYLASELKRKGVVVDLDLIDVASLLHDIGRIKVARGHAETSGKILRELGEEEVAKVVERHGPYRFRELIGWEERLVAYADGRVDLYEIISLEERFKDAFEKHPESKEFLLGILPVFKKFEDEIFGIIGEEKRDLQTLKNA